MVGVSSGGRIGPFGTLFDCGSIGGKTDGELLDLFASGEAVEAAFQALVVRHGPTVLRACRRVLSDPNDADDAFQATFLVLARRASSGSIGRRDSLGPWLHGVALRVARKARVAAARRRRHEAEVAGRPEAGCRRPDDLAVAVREEVDRLPESLRTPVILCYLEDMTYRSAARRLRVSEGTIRGRLVRARSLLRARLGRHECPAATGPAGGPASGARPPRVPPALAAATVRSARALAPGGAGMASIPAAIAGLVEGVVMMRLVTRWIIGTLSLSTVCLVAGGAAALTAKGEDKPSAVKSVDPEREPRKVEGQPKQPPDSLPVQVLTLDDAIARLLMRSLDLRSKFVEIPIARADMLIAGLRNRPGASADGPAFRMGQYAAMNSFDTRLAPSQFDSNVTFPDRPIPPPQSDLNVSDPVVTSLKRRMRSKRAGMATTVVEAQYQDAVRIRIGELYSAYVDVQEMQELIRLQDQAAARCRPLLRATAVGKQQGTRSQVDEDVLMSCLLSLAGPEDGRQGERARARRRALARLLELSTGEADRLKVEPIIAPMHPLPPVAELIRLGLERRPDIAALRLGLIVAQADAEKASKQPARTGDSYLLYQPYLFQDKPAGDRKDAESYALGVTVPLPVSERNGGNVLRARLNLEQIRIQLASAEKVLTKEVEQFHRQCESSLAEVRGLQTALRNEWRACQVVGQKYAAGEVESVDVRNAWLALRKTEIRHLELMLKYRRSLLALNTAVGLRLFP